MRPSSLAPQVKRAAVVPAGVPSRPWVETGPTAQGWRHPNDGDLRGGKTLSELGLSMLGRRSYYGDMPKRETTPDGSSRRRGNHLALVEVRTLKTYADGESPFLEAYVGAGDPGVDVMWTFSVTQPHQELEVRFGNGAAAAYAHQVIKRCAELDSLIATQGDPTGALAKEKLFRLRCAASMKRSLHTIAARLIPAMMEVVLAPEYNKNSSMVKKKRRLTSEISAKTAWLSHAGFRHKLDRECRRQGAALVATSESGSTLVCGNPLCAHAHRGIGSNKRFVCPKCGWEEVRVPQFSTHPCSTPLDLTHFEAFHASGCIL